MFVPKANLTKPRSQSKPHAQHAKVSKSFIFLFDIQILVVKMTVMC